jgi:hypothetical protein
MDAGPVKPIIHQSQKKFVVFFGLPDVQSFGQLVNFAVGRHLFRLYILKKN